MEIQGIVSLQNKLQVLRLQAAAASEASVAVGYTAKYALFVHENMEMKLAGKPRPSGLGEYWGPEGAGNKFLEGPARELGDQLGEQIAASVAAGQPLLTALYLAGLRLQRESQLRVPVEYGFLRASAFTEKE